MMKILLILLFAMFAYGSDHAVKFTVQYTVAQHADPTLESGWIPLQGHSFSLGYVRHPLWFRIVAENSENRRIERYLQFSESFSEVTDFYVQAKNGTHLFANGLARDLSTRDIALPQPTILLAFAPNETKTVYVRYHSRFTNWGAFSFYSEKTFLKETLLYNAFFMFYFGAMLMMVIYNLFLYFSLKDTGYLYYTGFVVSFTLWVFLYSGYSLYFVDADWHYVLHFATPVGCIFFVLFSQYILETKKHQPKMHRLLNLMAIILLIDAIAVVIDLEHGYYMVNLIGLILFPLILVVAILSIKRTASALTKYYLVALMLFIFSMTVIAETGWGHLPLTLFTKYSFIVGSLIEAALFSLILAYKINAIRTRQLKTQQELAALKENEAERLQKMVTEQTLNLSDANESLTKTLGEKDVLLKEVYHRVKNNLQTVSSMLWLQKNTITDPASIKILGEMKTRIQSMALVHELLYSSDDLTHIDAKAYLFKLIDEIVASQQHPKTLTLNKEIDSTLLDTNHAIYMGILVVEVLTNAIKHNMDRPLKIDFIFRNMQHFFLLQIEDDGKGFDTESAAKKQSLGINLIMQMSRKLSQKQPQITHTNGTRFILEIDLWTRNSK